MKLINVLRTELLIEKLCPLFFYFNLLESSACKLVADLSLYSILLMDLGCI